MSLPKPPARPVPTRLQAAGRWALWATAAALIAGCAAPVVSPVVPPIVSPVAPHAGTSEAASVAPLASERWAPIAGQTGLRYERDTRRPGEVLHWLKLDLRDTRLRLTLSPPSERGRVLPAFDNADSALAVLNASFFDLAFTPRGLTRSQGEDWSPVLYPQGSPLLSCTRRQRCTLQLAAPYALAEDAWLAVAGTPWLVRDGRPRTLDDDRRCGAFCHRSHPRTAVGLDREGRHLILVLAEGRRPDAEGLSLSTLAQRMAERGVSEALNLDGGGSSSLLLEGRTVMARPALEPDHRPLANALLVHLLEETTP